MFLSISAEGQDCNAGEKKKFPFTTIGAGADFVAVRRASAEFRQSIQTKAGKISMSCTRHYFYMDQYRSASRLYPIISPI
jgi:hypothetical protein